MLYKGYYGLMKEIMKVKAEHLDKIEHYKFYKAKYKFGDKIIEDGKYYNKDAPSYGKNGFYSASVKTYIDFLKEYNSNNLNKSTKIDFSL